MLRVTTQTRARVRRAPVNDFCYAHHAETLALKAAGKTREDGWSAYSWLMKGAGTEVKVAPHRLLKSGPRKGQKTWSPRKGATTIVVDRDVVAEARRFERKDGRCAKCIGEKQTMVSWHHERGATYAPCRRCGGTGRAPKRKP